MGELLFAFMAGAMVGGGLVSWTWERAFARVARFQRVGSPEAPVASPGTQPAHSPVNTEASAQRRITLDSIQRGADEIMATAKAQGYHISRKDAEEQARQMLSGLHPLGGAG